jgi:hypothetical protein
MPKLAVVFFLRSCTILRNSGALLNWKPRWFSQQACGVVSMQSDNGHRDVYVGAL